MKVIVQAVKKIEIYEVTNNTWYDNKPIITRDSKYCETELKTIKELEVSDSHILLNTYNYDDILITDHKGDKVDGKFKIIYDLEEDTVYLKSDVCVELVEPNKEEVEKELEDKLKIWNKETIEKDERLNAYCELHKLDKETVDINELKRLIPYNKGGVVLPCSYSDYVNAFKRSMGTF